MSLPYFYIPGLDAETSFVDLPEDTAKHVVQVLRMKKGEALLLTDGKGNRMQAVIDEVQKKSCTVKITEKRAEPFPGNQITIAISLLKNTSRFEWFIEKATELGIARIIPLICERTEKEKFRTDRMQQIVISAMQQSQQSWLTELTEPVLFKNFLSQTTDHKQKFIAHCNPADEKKSLSAFAPFDEAILLIGPEGDFSETEILLALEQQYLPVSLGETRLRTETAGITAAALMRLVV